MFEPAIFALVCATLFAGVALYISLVEHPARLGLEDGPLLAQWQPSYKRALPIQSVLAAVGGAVGLFLGYLAADWRWFTGSVLLLANWPFTLAVIMPVNHRLMPIEPRDAGPETRALLVRWGKLHNVRSALGTAAALFFGWAVISPS
jgi:hypothetical protein